MAHMSEARNGGNHPSLDSKEDMRTRLDTATDSTSQGFLSSQRARFDRLTDDLAAIADCKDELQRKIRLAQLKFELVDCFNRAEQEALEVEVHAFKEVCKRLSEAIAADEDRNSEREAA